MNKQPEKMFVHCANSEALNVNLNFTLACGVILHANPLSQICGCVVLIVVISQESLEYTGHDCRI